MMMLQDLLPASTWIHPLKRLVIMHSMVAISWLKWILTRGWSGLIIDYQAFRRCKSLEQISIPSAVNCIGYYICWLHKFGSNQILLWNGTVCEWVTITLVESPRLVSQLFWYLEYQVHTYEQLQGVLLYWSLLSGKQISRNSQMAISLTNKWSYSVVSILCQWLPLLSQCSVLPSRRVDLFIYCLWISSEKSDFIDNRTSPWNKLYTEELYLPYNFGTAIIILL